MKAVGRKKDRKHAAATSNNNDKSRSITVSVPSSPPTSVELRGVTVHFPFKPYKCQEDYMSKVLDALHHSENALLESPTGTGKTLCLLCSALAWQREQAREAPAAALTQQQAQQQAASQQQAQTVTAKKPRKKIPTIIYASRTHSQLSQVVRELKNTRYRPKHALLGSRAQMCVNKKVKTKDATVSDINHDCSRLGKDRKCSFRNNLEGHTPAPNEPGAPFGMQPVMDMEDLLQMGQKRKVCPFYYTRSLVEDAELILVPYNYLFDKDARDTTLQHVQWNNSVVIFDEAHNLEGFASDAASFDLSSLHVAGCIAEVQKVIAYQQHMPELAERISVDNLVRLKSLFLTLEDYMLHKISTDRSVFCGDYMMQIFKEGAMMTHANHAMFVNEARKVSEIIMDLRSGSGSKGQTKMDFFLGCVKRVFAESSEGLCFAKARAYRVHVSSTTTTPSGGNAKVRTISYWCFAPSLAMQELANLDIRSVIVTSGTLSPLPSYSMELGIPFPHTLENPHIISDEQIHVRTIGTGISGKLLSSSYNRRDDVEYTTELGSTIVNIARVVPAGMLIFFPSYGVMEKCIEAWGGPASRRNNYNNNNKKNAAFFAARRKQANGSSQYSFPCAPNYYASTSTSTPQSVWKRLLCQKAVILEPKSTSDLPEAIADFHKYLNQPKSTGCILMGVCRGKISEGIDFSHDMCRAVIITGLPFAPFMDPKVKLKREYLDGERKGQNVKASGEGGFGNTKPVGIKAPTTLSGMEWYTQQAHRAVNQAVGRVIRNKHDYGAVLLLDQRFGDPRNRDGLSKWVRSRALPNETFGIAVSGLAKFYRQAKEKAVQLEAERRAASVAPPPPPPIASVLLAYENEPSKKSSEESNLLLTTDRIAVVKSSQGSDDQGYIPQDQVLATMELKDMQPKEQRVESKQPKEERTKPAGLTDLYNKQSSSTSSLQSGSSSGSAWESVRATDNTTVASAGTSRGASKSQTTAQLFFATAKSRLDARDFASLRKLLVSMKKHGDSKDSVAYLKDASKLITILIQYDDIESDEHVMEQSLCHLFFPLLPQAHQQGVQKMALRKQLQRSDFIKHCQEHLPHEKHKSFYTSVFSALKQVYCIPPTKTVSRSLYLKACLSVIQYLYDNELHVKKSNIDLSMVDRYCVLIPPSLRIISRGLLTEILARQNTKRIKSKEKQREGENGIDHVRFSQIQKRTAPKVEVKPENPEDLENQRAMQAALMEADKLNTAKRDRVEAGLEPKKPANPYLSSKAARPTKKPFTQHASASNERRDTSSRLNEAAMHKKSQQDRVSSILRNVDLSPFEKGKSKPKVRANSKGTNCGICEQSCKEPFMPPCGHLACSSCWLQWFRKSHTCPVCREPASKDSLARVVYERKPGAGVPSMSQLCTGDSDSEDDLEIV